MDSLTDHIHTISDRVLCLQAIDAYEKKLFSPDFTVPESEYASLIEAFISDKKEKEVAIKDLRTTLMTMPVLRLTLAFTPTKEFIAQLATTLRNTAAKRNTVVEITTDPSIVAGLQLSDSGKLIDLSLEKKVGQVDIGSVVKKYFHFV